MIDSSREIREWYPLESSPEVFTSMARQWGLPDHIAFHDVYGLDEESLALVPQPVHAVILLFPDTDEIVKYRREVNECLDPSVGQMEGEKPRARQGPLWIPQTELVGHSCGTFAMIHALASLPTSLGLSLRLAPFFEACRAAPPVKRTELFASCELIRQAHNGAVQAGQTELRDTDWEDCDHFLSFIAVPTGISDMLGEQAVAVGQNNNNNSNNNINDNDDNDDNNNNKLRLFEMDGNPPRTGPLDRGPCTDLLRDTARVVREHYLARSGDNVHFSMMVLAG